MFRGRTLKSSLIQSSNKKRSWRNKEGKSGLKESQAFRYKLTGTEEIPVLRLRGGSGGDQERFLCEICGKILTSKRNLDLHVDSVHVTHPDFDCILSSDGLLKWKCGLCNNLVF